MKESSGGLLWQQGITECTACLSALGIDLAGKHVLLAVSGGMDSMCMLHLLEAMHAQISVAHVNYGMRGSDSDADTELVLTTCERMQMTFHEKRVDLHAITERTNESTQQAARRIRYTWFDELHAEFHYDFICTAHHQDDAAESFFINVIRGTGLKGLTGIPVLRGNILRPLLCFTRKDIRDLVRDRDILFRDDASNFEKDYLRNRIRHDVIPLFQKERQKFISRMHTTQERLNDEYALLREFLTNLKSEICTVSEDVLLIDRVKLMRTTSPAIVLHDITKAFGFSYDQCKHMIGRADSTGIKYLSGSYTIFIEREKFHLTMHPGNAAVEEIILDEIHGEYQIPGGELRIEDAEQVPVFTQQPQIEYIDKSRLREPLILRHWRHGDVFFPFGGAGSQKLQDYFTNEKLSTMEKSQVWILTSGDEIVWVVGMRLDHRYRVTPETETVTMLKWIPSEI